ncbi:SPOR domain-containing protein [Solimicrobium silvestre]|uniref:Sporulation related domain n=1 Tax=Solimicrobium silvestre TaxID=2099400 RepID=A0A2S9GZK1_9BURK|nr:SPOR domain-containing protein [Solimicrobium silvestre]PRC93162.1 Sporulation related domain [Solimicrobium silvestre]
MSLFSIFSKKQPEVTSVAEALAGTADATPAKSKSRKSDTRHTDAQNEQLVPEKKRARRRLIGAIAMVLAVVIGLPMVLDSEPKPLNKNIVIQIPSKDATVASLDPKEEIVQNGLQVDTPIPAPTAPKQPSVPPVAKAAPDTRTITPVTTVAEAAPKTSKPEPKIETKAEAKVETAHSSEMVAKKEAAAKPKAESKADFKADPKPSDSHVTSADESARAMAILGGADTSAKATAVTSRIVVQVGAFATQEKVNELQSKLTSAGFKSFTQKVATDSGDKIRVRIGPFSDKDAADKVKTQLEKLGLTGKLVPL